MLYKIYASCGRLAYRITLPLLQVYLRHTERAYVILENNGKFLLCKSWLGKGLWGLPGGGMRPKETPKQAIERETEEELGLSLAGGNFKLIAKGKWTSEGLGQSYQIYACDFRVKNFKPHKLEITDAAWLSLDQLDPSNTHREVLNAIKRSRS